MDLEGDKQQVSGVFDSPSQPGSWPASLFNQAELKICMYRARRCMPPGHGTILNLELPPLLAAD